MKDSKLRVALVTHAPFPLGNVSTMRYTSYLKALVKSGIFCYVLVYCPTRMAAHIKERSGSYDGIIYQYSTDITWKKYNILNKVVYLFKGLVKSIYYLIKQDIRTVILYGDNPFVVNLFYCFFCKFTGRRFVGDRSELPTVEERESKLKMFVYGLKQRMFDGMIIMTKQLMQFYHQYSAKDNFLFFLPMTIDPTRFDGIVRKRQEVPYIALVFGTHNRDGLMESLLSYDMYCSKGGSYELRLIGDYDNMPNKAMLDAQISSSKYKRRIHILGKQPNNKVPEILFSASILLTTPNFFISGGFPTKLGEYMLSGVPIVATKVGELLDYIEPDVDMLMSEPADYDAISNNLLELERNPELARALSNNAFIKAKNVFCADVYIDDLIVFLRK